ncbi:MAG: hypothetical protein J0J06_01480 [Sphingomonas sp.]|uniref:hypothetical protein n=1 Tax=Sphingomonas sp. TaxID=28214 RepID=UPI001AC583B9|nr:hypothetical protein [Sphingomonas sp.]MBN8814101.1 hypothetical protein [Sphingomonas sp.]
MKTTRKFHIAAATILLASIVTPGVSATKRTVLPPPLLPLSEKDMTTGESGCETSISQGNDTFIYIINQTFILRTASGAKGLQVCRPADVQDFESGGVTVNCGARRLSMRPVGKTKSHEEADSVEGSGILTMSDGTHSRQVKVSWGTAC